MNNIIANIADFCTLNAIPYNIVVDDIDMQAIMVYNRKHEVINKIISSIASIVESSGLHIRTDKVRGGYVIAVSPRAITESEFNDIVEYSEMSFLDKLNKAFNSPVEITRYTPSIELSAISAVADMVHNESLGGVATPSGEQPKELFIKFAKAMKIIGDRLGIGPLQDRLKEQGIKWTISDDGLSIIFYIINGTTGAKQPIARISHDTLDSPNEFEEQLINMLDFARAKAPGSTKQERQRIQDLEKVVRDTANALVNNAQEQEEVMDTSTSLAAGLK